MKIFSKIKEIFQYSGTYLATCGSPSTNASNSRGTIITQRRLPFTVMGTRTRPRVDSVEESERGIWGNSRLDVIIPADSSNITSTSESCIVAKNTEHSLNLISFTYISQHVALLQPDHVGMAIDVLKCQIKSKLNGLLHERPTERT